MVLRTPACHRRPRGDVTGKPRETDAPTSRRAMTTTADASTPLLDGARGRGWRPSVVVLGLGASGAVAALIAVARATGAVGSTWTPARGRPWLAPAPTRSERGAERTFTLHTQCMDRATKLAMAEFTYTGAPEGYLVRHDYGSKSFFEHDRAVKMERVVLDNEERAWRVTTKANFEFGFALRNAVTGEWRQEIGSFHSPLAKAPCAQRYGKYFNRVVTLEKAGPIDYVYGSCDTTCPEGYTENQWVDQPLSGDVPVSTSASAGLELGVGDDARLITIRTALPLKSDGYGPAGRALVQRDTRFAESEDASRWIMAIVDPYPATEMKLAMLEVTKDSSDRLRVRQIGSKRYNLGHECVRGECAVARYDVSEIWHTKSLTAFTYNFWATALQYTIAHKGDTKSPAFEHSFPDSAYISKSNVWTMQESGKWGMDIDVRRVVFTSAGLSGTSWDGQALRMGVVERAYFMPHTASEAYWVASLAGGGKQAMAMIKLYTDADGKLLAKVDSGREGAQCPDPPEINGVITKTAWLRQWDVLKCTVKLEQRWNGAPVKTVKNKSSDSYEIGVVALAYLLAPEMTSSLAAAFNAPA